MTDPEAAKIIAALIQRSAFGLDSEDYPDPVAEGLRYLIEARKEHPELAPFSLWSEMAKRGMIT